MTTARRASQPRGPLERGSTSTLVLHRGVGEGFSVGQDWRFDVVELTARFITLGVTAASGSTRWRLEVDDALQLTARGTLACSRQSRSELAPPAVRVARVATSRASLVIHVPRSLKITRHEPTPSPS
ncbi:MAG: hypothetical protein ACRDQH_19315 [Pseudonocardiaceae bacterium]